MSDPNSAATVAAQHDPNSNLARENADLRSRLAKLERDSVVEGRFKGEAPRYFLNGPCQLDDTLYETGSTIDYIGTPNLDMVPLNDPAKRAMQDVIECQTEGARRVAMKAGREFYGLVTDRNVLIETALADAKHAVDSAVPTILMPTPRGEVPAMPHTEEARAAERRGPGRPRKVMASEGPGVPNGPASPPGALGFAPAPAPAIVGRRVS